MPFLLLFAFVPAVLLIALAVMLISGTIMFMLNRNNSTVDYISCIGSGLIEIFNNCSEKFKEFKKTQRAKKPKTVETIEIVVLKEK